MRKVFLFVIAALLVAGCETYSAAPYISSAQNVIAIQEAVADRELRVGEFTAVEGINQRPTCRLTAPLDLSPGVPIASYLQEAFQTEFLRAGVYNIRAENEIFAELTELQLTDTGTGSWRLSIFVMSASHDGFSVTVDHPFSTSFAGDQACQNAVNAFPNAVRALINATINHPEFRELI